jgi:adenylylsulfate kinase-like enzyme
MQHSKNGLILTLSGGSEAQTRSLVKELASRLAEQMITTIPLEADDLEKGLNKDLSDNEKDNIEYSRRVAEAAKLMASGGVLVVIDLHHRLMDHTDMFAEICGDYYFHAHLGSDEISNKADMILTNESDLLEDLLEAISGRLYL